MSSSFLSQLLFINPYKRHKINIINLLSINKKSVNPFKHLIINYQYETILSEFTIEFRKWKYNKFINPSAGQINSLPNDGSHIWGSFIFAVVINIIITCRNNLKPYCNLRPEKNIFVEELIISKRWLKIKWKWRWKVNTNNLNYNNIVIIFKNKTHIPLKAG